MQQAIILFGHGSRDPSWRAPIEAVAQRLRELRPDAAVRCAYLELDSPDFGTAAEELIAAGATRIAVLPMFLGMGRHAREDLPVLVARSRDKHTGVAFDLRPAVGEDPRVLELLAAIAGE